MNAEKERNKAKNRKKKLNTSSERPEETIPFPEQQSRKLFTQLRSESSNTNKNSNNQNQTSPYPNYDPHHILTSLRSSEANDNSLGDTLSAYTESSPFSKHFVADDYRDTLPLENVPGPPQDLRAPVVRPRFVILSWRPPDYNNEDIIAYSVYYRQENNER